MLFHHFFNFAIRTMQFLTNMVFHYMDIYIIKTGSSGLLIWGGGGHSNAMKCLIPCVFY